MPGGPNQGKEKKLLSAIQKCANEITDKLGLGHR